MFKARKRPSGKSRFFRGDAGELGKLLNQLLIAENKVEHSGKCGRIIDAAPERRRIETGGSEEALDTVIISGQKCDPLESQGFGALLGESSLFHFA